MNARMPEALNNEVRGIGNVSAATRALLILGLAQAGRDVSNYRYEIGGLLREELAADIKEALLTLLGLPMAGDTTAPQVSDGCATGASQSYHACHTTVSQMSDECITNVSHVSAAGVFDDDIAFV
jgi:hypothetical protein